MTLHLTTPKETELEPRILVMGVGGAGGNAINNMISQELAGVDFVVANTDSQALSQSRAEKRIQLGAALTQGLGAGAAPEVGAKAAEESRAAIEEALADIHMCFIAAGMGGGTGTGGAPVVARLAREMGVLTVGVVTKPFRFEGARRMRQAEEGIEALRAHVDTLIVIPNQNLFRVADESTTFGEAFTLADEVLHQGVKGVTDLMVRPGIVNLDFADVRAVMREMGSAMMGSGEATGENRAVKAAELAIANPLLDDISLKGAGGVLINITGGPDLKLFEVDAAANRIREEVESEAAVYFGSALDPEMDGSLRVSVVATGIGDRGARADASGGEGRDVGGASPTTDPFMGSNSVGEAPAAQDAPGGATVHNAPSGDVAADGPATGTASPQVRAPEAFAGPAVTADYQITGAADAAGPGAGGPFGIDGYGAQAAESATPSAERASNPATAAALLAEAERRAGHPDGFEGYEAPRGFRRWEGDEGPATPFSEAPAAARPAPVSSAPESGPAGSAEEDASAGVEPRRESELLKVQIPSFLRRHAT